MDARDLKIGNIVEQGYIVTIQYREGVLGCLVSKSMFSSGHDWEFIKMDYIKSIPLSESWLERAGFSEIDDDGLFQSDQEQIFHLQHRYLAEDGYDVIFDTQFLTIIQSIHQLQNIFYCLTGTELTFKEATH